MLAAMHKYVNINPEEFPAAMVERLQLQRLLPLAIDRAIFENLPALSERASSVACNTTAELILKVLPQRDGLPRAPSMQRFIAAFRNSSPGVTHRVRAAQHIMLSCAASCQSNLLHHDVSGVRSLLVRAIHGPL